MKLKLFYFLFCCVLTILILSFKLQENNRQNYQKNYFEGIENFNLSLLNLQKKINADTLINVAHIQNNINTARLYLKSIDFWLRYLEPTTYKKINGPLPVEWETEVFEKYEKPYRREGSGLTLAYLYLDENASTIKKDSLIHLIKQAQQSLAVYKADSITKNLSLPDHFYLCNRLHLLNLAAIYTTGFECPNTEQIIVELMEMLQATTTIYKSFNTTFPDYQLPKNYLDLYDSCIVFVKNQPKAIDRLDHFLFIKNYINPLFAINQQLILNYKISSKSNVDFALNKTAKTIFDKNLYDGQNSKGIFLRVKDSLALKEINQLGKQLFYDPILSANNKRSCASCHKAEHYFADTLVNTPLAFNATTSLNRNAPSLINAQFNHLIMQDGAQLTLLNQTKAVITNKDEMGSDATEVLKKVLSCNEYKKGFTKLLKFTPQEKDITMDHICSAIINYYSKFSNYYSDFDEAMINNKPLNSDAQKGFNLFMGKAQCATCHFIPQFNGVKPPYVGSEFEVLGTPSTIKYTQLSQDKGRYMVNPAIETANAFRTGTLRNADKTKPYMHNGVFKTMDDVLNFYNNGGGVGHGLVVNNQTLSSDSLHLSVTEIKQLKVFITSLNETVKFEALPTSLPKSKIKNLNARKVGGDY